MSAIMDVSGVVAAGAETKVQQAIGRVFTVRLVSVRVCMRCGRTDGRDNDVTGAAV